VKMYLKAFLLVGLSMAILTHFVTTESMPWWPDTAIMSAVFGTLAALGTYQHHRTNRILWNALKGAFRRS
jgi:hypothetical protein